MMPKFLYDEDKDEFITMVPLKEVLDLVAKMLPDIGPGLPSDEYDTIEAIHRKIEQRFT